MNIFIIYFVKIFGVNYVSIRYNVSLLIKNDNLPALPLFPMIDIAFFKDKTFFLLIFLFLYF